MPSDVPPIGAFYSSFQGAMAARLIRARLARMWPRLDGLAVLGVGYTAPFLRLWRDQAYRCVALSPAPLEVTRWPSGANLTCAAEEHALPFPDLSFDRVLLLHGLEGAENARRLLREVWRVMKDDGAVMAVVPNRAGLWAYSDATPFGYGRPYSSGQLDRLLAASLFRVERRDGALFLPPVSSRALLRGAQLWEHGGRRIVPRLAGLAIAEATKDLYGAIPAGRVVSARMVVADTG